MITPYDIPIRPVLFFKARTTTYICEKSLILASHMVCCYIQFQFQIEIATTTYRKHADER